MSEDDNKKRVTTGVPGLAGYRDFTLVRNQNVPAPATKPIQLPGYVITFDKRTIQSEIEAMKRAFESIAPAFQRAMKAVSVAFRSLFPIVQEAALYSARVEHGGNASDADEFPDDWQSTVCGAWLCGIGEVCPSDLHHLKCTHSCHK